MTQFEAVDARILKRLPATAGSGEFILDIHLRANAGITALFGPSGAGKSLTLNCLAGFARPDAGRIVVENAIFFDHDAGVHLPPQQRRCGYIFQDHALFPHMTVRQNLQFATGSSLARRRRINDLLSNFELIDLAERKPAQLSGGQRQRAALARALITEPRLILLDEPTRGLDIRLRAGFFGLLKHLNTLKIPIVLVTHDLSDCFDIADNVCLLDNGRILQSGTREGVLFKPATSSIAQSLGIFAVIPATITSLDPGRNTSRLQLLLTEISAAYLPGHLLGDRGFVCVPHSELRILARGIPARDNTLELRVRDVGTSPQGVRISFEPAESSLVATVSESEWVNLRGEERLSVQIPSRAVSFVGN